jgi:predicted nucleotidyltransferase
LTVQTKPLLDYVLETGFPFTSRLVHLFVGGSELHGAKLGGTDDHDIYGAFVEPADRSIGIDPAYEHFVWSTAGNDRRNTANDVDVTLYSLRKWARLAARGNPTCLHFLFAKNECDSDFRNVWNRIIDNRELFLARDHIQQFIGFADAQLGRLTGERGRGKKGQRPELEAEFGYDTKAGMHSIRLLYEAVELMNTGKLTFPRPEKNLLINIRGGAWTLDRLIAEATKLMHQVKIEAANSFLPENVDREAISRLISETYLQVWS